MKAVILAGGFGTRLAEETTVKPKPLIEIGGMPIIWHIMKIYSHYGVNEFIVCLGYKGEEIKNFFSNYSSRMSDIKVDMANSQIDILENRAEDWKVTLVDTGKDAMTGGRIKAVAPYLSKDESFCLTYGDGVGDIDIRASIDFHKSHGGMATVTAVTPPGRFGVLDIVEDKVLGFREKIASDQYRINAGFFVLNYGALDYIDGPQTVWEQEPMIGLAQAGEMRAWEHDGFWMPMDTLRDKQKLESLWKAEEAPWRVWQ